MKMAVSPFVMPIAGMPGFDPSQKSSATNSRPVPSRSAHLKAALTWAARLEEIQREQRAKIRKQLIRQAFL
ncbi:hypothetical protein [Cupriavidus necator]|uniref:hypothetical protein n=1 Tax=Cupriavidus necator TaxID=106590 RepID=UPI0012D321C7|nr:hypothetical protein [Cupriavidus necator]